MTTRPVSLLTVCGYAHGPMEPILDLAPTGRAKCRGCAQPIAKGELRLGDVQDNPFADDATMTHWYHPRCAACLRPEVAMQALGLPAATALPDDERDRLRRAASLGIEHHRLPRLCGAERAKSARAACRSCKEPIAKDVMRLKLVFFENGRFEPGGFVHAGCAGAYFGVTDLLERVRWFTPELDEADAAALAQALG